MSFHPQKCKLLLITRKPSPIIAQYNIHGHVLGVADTAKYLGVTLHKPCAWSKHINQTAKKANNTRAFLQRNLSRAPTSVQKRAYETLVRPILEYASSVWDPHAEADIYKLEMVQHRYARYTCNNFGRTSSATAMLHQIGWDTLHGRRAKSRLAMQFPIAHNLVYIPRLLLIICKRIILGRAMQPSSVCHMHGLWPIVIASSLMLPECGMPSHLTW